MIFIFKSAITLAMLYCCFFTFLSKETFHRFNRIMLVGIMAAALTIPLIQLTTTTPTVVNEGLYQIERDFTYTAISVKDIADTPEHHEWAVYAVIIYLAGVVIMLCIAAIQFVTLLRYMRGGLRHTDCYGNTIILKTNDISSFSVLKYIVMSVNDYETYRTYILTHEQEHIRLGHTYDLMLLGVMKIMQWFNPFIWFLGRDLRAVHEFEADQAVINKGIDAKTYQQLLVMKAVGERLQLFTNCLNHSSLKRRIIMMYNKKTNRWMMLKALCAIPVAALAITAFAKPMAIEKVENAITTAEEKITRTVKHTVESRLVPESKKEAKREIPQTKAQPAMAKDASQTESKNADMPKNMETAKNMETVKNVRQTKTKKNIPVYNDMPEYTGQSSIKNGVRIKRTDDCTYVTLICTCRDNVGLYKIGGKENRTFIEDVETGDHYKARRVKDETAVFGGDGFVVTNMKGKRWAVTLEFPPLPDNVKHIRFWHLDNWTGSEYRIINIKDIEEI
ncbi:M56 family metallopeptidase [Xylanibacter muris]|uniref:M56 family metallopeptidase n=1 Tax=Xylanibacter muris TaxID=2736290 RepID=A0ABX2AMD7_9BACT|nr:M56 family metallopeptidase [Xylanibacter muris]NPD91207.1 M56 family metallopeptidase [Xylanibacter muris]